MPKQKMVYQVSHRMVGAQMRTTPTTVNVTCTEIKQGFFNVEVDEQVDPSADQVSGAAPIYKKAWVNDRGHSSHHYAFWFTTCPYGPVKVKSTWKGNPPPISESMGAPSSAGFDYTLSGFEQSGNRKAARIGFRYVQRATNLRPVETSYTGGMLIDNANGQILDLTVAKTERTGAIRTAAGAKAKSAASIYVTRLLRL